MDVVLQAFRLVFDPYVLTVIFFSALYGLFVGAVPGLTATMATALLVPVTFFMPPIPAIATMVTATAMAIFSGDIPGCLLRIPGTPASASEEQWSDEVKDRRLRQVLEAVTKSQTAFNLSCVGRVMPVLLERRGRHPPQRVARGRTVA